MLRGSRCADAAPCKRRPGSAMHHTRL